MIEVKPVEVPALAPPGAPGPPPGAPAPPPTPPASPPGQTTSEDDAASQATSEEASEPAAASSAPSTDVAQPGTLGRLRGHMVGGKYEPRDKEILKKERQRRNRRAAAIEPQPTIIEEEADDVGPADIAEASAQTTMDFPGAAPQVTRRYVEVAPRTLPSPPIPTAKV